MSRARRRTFWSLLALAVIAFVTWLLYVPRDPERVFEAIPASATFVSAHQGLGAEWPSLARSPLITNLLAAAGVKSEDLAKLATDAETQDWLRRLATRETVLAYVPSLGLQDRSAWVFATWIGSRSLTLRMQLALSRTAEFRPIPIEHGGTVYITRTRFAQPGQRLSLALLEGVLVGCISSDPIGARWLVETSERYPWKPSLRTSGQLARARALLARPAPAHWGWMATPGAELLAYTLDVSSERRMRLTLASATALPDTGNPISPVQLAPAARFLGDSPDACVVLPLAAAVPLAVPSDTPLWSEIARNLLDTNGVSAGALAVGGVLDSEHASRIRGPLGPLLGPLVKGLKVPTVVLGWETGSEDEARNRLTRALDQINARYGLALTLRDVADGTNTLMRVDDTRGSVYAKFEPDERIAAVWLDGWLFLCSNAGILKRRLAAPGGTAAWIAAATRAPAAGALWVDLKAAAGTVKDAVGATALIAMLSGDGDRKALRQTLEGWRTAAEMLKPFEEGCATLNSTGGATRVDVSLGME